MTADLIVTEYDVQVIDATNETVITITDESVVLIEAKEVIQINVSGTANVQPFPFSNITEFTVTHNLGRSVGVQTVDSSGKDIGVAIVRTPNTVTIYSEITISGTLIII